MKTTRLAATCTVLIVGVLLVAACGSNSPAKADAATAVSATVPKEVPAGTTLRFGDQVQAIATVLKAGGQDQNFPYSVKYAGFIGGPAMLQAFKAGAIDAGYVADTPLIFAQAAKQDVVAVAAFETEHATEDVIARPGSGVTSWKELKGKKVAYQQGTSAEAVLLLGLKHTGLALSDITSVNLPFTQITAALQGGSVDVAVSQAPLDTAYLKQHEGATILERPQDEPLRLSFLIASKKALEDPAKAAAIRDYAVRLVKAYKYISAHLDQWAQEFYVKNYHLPLNEALDLIKQSGSYRFISIPGTLGASQQELADLYYDAKEIPSKLDAVQEFDGRFNPDVLKAQAS
jgi:sulfonate transport system substrate-binding protein